MNFYGSKTVTETRFRGSMVSSVTTMCQTIKIETDQQVLAEFLRFMEEMKGTPGRFDPEFKIKNDRKSGRVDRITKCWSELS